MTLLLNNDGVHETIAGKVKETRVIGEVSLDRHEVIDGEAPIPYFPILAEVARKTRESG